MPDASLILGIETSCDETAAAVVGADRVIHSNRIASQLEQHQQHGGVVPEIAARAHLSLIDKVINAALEEAGVGIADIDVVAATAGPGLIGGVLVGSMTAKGIATSRGIPYFAINHLEGHALSARLTCSIHFPYLLLLVSGGHSQLLAVEAAGRYHRYGTTLDDAAGEAFDKAAKKLDLGLPGGPRLEAAAETGDATAFALPRPLKGADHCHFSFSGLKTALANTWDGLTEEQRGERQNLANAAASLQAAICDCLEDRSWQAMQRFRSDYPQCPQPDFVVAGGVAANRLIRGTLAAVAETGGFGFHAPPLPLCTDNAAMIAWAAAERIAAGLPADSMASEAVPRWPLDPAAPAPQLGRRKAAARAEATDRQGKTVP